MAYNAWSISTFGYFCANPADNVSVSPIALKYFPETFNIYRYKEDATVSAFGELPDPDVLDITNLNNVGTVKGRVNTGDSLEPDVLGTEKDHGPDVTSMWLVWFAIPDGFEIFTGDYVQNTDDSTRYFQIQFIDRYPGGLKNHHYEARLETTEVFRNG